MQIRFVIKQAKFTRRSNKCLFRTNFPFTITSADDTVNYSFSGNYVSAGAGIISNIPIPTHLC